MLPKTSEIGARLAAVMPSSLAMLTPDAEAHGLPQLDAVVVVVVDGLGWHNLQARRGHARTISQLEGSPIETVIPSTTGAALSAITTGSLPGAHGLVGYRIRHPQFGIRTTLSEWDGIDSVRDWQLQPTQFEKAHDAGVRSYAIGRSSHQHGGLTRAILTGAEYVSGDTIEERTAHALRLAKLGGRSLIYLYIDEIDRAGHEYGWESNEWIHRLEQLDSAVAELMHSMPTNTGLVLTADHGMVDVHYDEHLLLDTVPGLLDGVALIGGEPRLRYLYMDHPDTVADSARKVEDLIGDQAWVFTREEAIASGMWGVMGSGVPERIGEIIIAAKGSIALYMAEEESSRQMIGQHGSFTPMEREIPLLVSASIQSEAFQAEVDRQSGLLSMSKRKTRKPRSGK